MSRVKSPGTVDFKIDPDMLHRNWHSDSPSSEQMNQRVPLAHYLARPAEQRASGLRQRVEHGLGSVPSRCFLPPRGCARRWANVVVVVDAGRVSGDSDCSGPINPPPPTLLLSPSPLRSLSARYPLTQKASHLRAHQANYWRNIPTSALTNGFMAHPRV